MRRNKRFLLFFIQGKDITIDDDRGVPMLFVDIPQNSRWDIRIFFGLHFFYSHHDLKFSPPPPLLHLILYYTRVSHFRFLHFFFASFSLHFVKVTKLFFASFRFVSLQFFRFLSPNFLSSNFSLRFALFHFIFIEPIFLFLL